MSFPASPTAPPVVLITGGSGGIGFAFSRLFARDGYRILWVALTAEELSESGKRLLTEFPDTPLHTFVADLATPGAPQQVFDWVQQNGWITKVLVNNAGFGCGGPIWTYDTARATAMIQTNVLALYQLTALFLPGMRQRNKGNIINIASIAAFQPDPYLALYGATKSFVLSFSQALHYELRADGSRVRATAVCPPPAHTGFGKAAHLENAPLFKSWLVVSPDTIARDGYRAMQRGQNMVVPNRIFHLLGNLLRRLPTAWLMWYGALQMGKPCPS